MKFDFYFAVSKTLDNLYTVLRNIRSATACLQNSESIQKENFLFYVFFWVIPRRLNLICRRFGTLCLFHLHRQVGIYLLAYENGRDRVFRNVGI